VNVKSDFQTDPGGQLRIIDGNHGSIEASNIQFEFEMSLLSTELLGNGRAVQAERGPASSENQWIIRSIPPGSYRTQMQSPGSYVASATWGGTDLLRHPIVVGTDGAGTPIEVVLRSDGAVVSGTVREAQQDNLPGAKDALPASNGAFVYFVPTSDSEGQFRTTRAMNGQFSMGLIPPGTYRVLAFASEQKELDFRNPVEMRKYESKGLVLSLAPNQHENLQTPLTLVDEP
jgi:hypothetical protein